MLCCNVKVKPKKVLVENGAFSVRVHWSKKHEHQLLTYY